MKYYTVALLFFVLACANEKKVSNDYAWLEGNWQSIDGRTSVAWSKISEQSYNGIGYSHAGDTTKVTEYMRLYLADNKWKLETKVIGQNNGKPITFSQTKQSTNKNLALENLNHDYPKIILYQYRNENALNVYLNIGLQKEHVFNYQRVSEIINLSFIE